MKKKKFKVIQKPSYLWHFVNNLWKVLIVAVLITLVTLDSIIDFVNSEVNFLNDGRDKLEWAISDYINSGYDSDLLDAINGRILTTTLISNSPIRIEIDNSVFYDSTDSYLLFYRTNSNENFTISTNDISELDKADSDKIYNYLNKPFYKYGVEIASIYASNSGDIIPENIRVNRYSIWGGLVESNYDEINLVHAPVPEGYRKIDDPNFFIIFTAVGDFDEATSHVTTVEHESPLGTMVPYSIKIDYGYVNTTRNIKIAFVIVLELLAVIILSLIIGTLTYFDARAIYQTFEYRRQTTNAMAHDLKTPLAIASVYVSNLRESLPPDNAKCAEYADQVEESITYMNSLINNILNFSNSESGNYKLTKTNINVRENLEKRVAAIAPALNEGQKSVVINGELSLNTDSNLWDQSINNILDNALKYCVDGSVITITLGAGEVSIINDILDDISNVSNLTEPFVKGDNSRGENSGSGLGLSIAMNNLTKLGYKLDVSCSDKKFIAKITV